MVYHQAPNTTDDYKAAHDSTWQHQCVPAHPCKHLASPRIAGIRPTIIETHWNSFIDHTFEQLELTYNIDGKTYLNKLKYGPTS